LQLTVYTHPLYTDAISTDARFPRLRYRQVAEALAQKPQVRVAPSPLARRGDLTPVHGPGFVDDFLSGRLSEAERRRIGLTPWTDQIRERTLGIMGGSLAALDAAMAETGIAGNLAGGTHHAHRTFGSGYCVFNDIALVVRRARTHWGITNILVVDLDVHQGDGTATLLSNDPHAHTFSLHCRVNFPFRKARSDRDVALPAGTTDGPYLRCLAYHLDRAFERSEPELVIYQAGVDALAADKLGRMRLSRAGLARRNDMVFARSARSGIPTVVLMGGGYAEPLSASVQAHTDVYQQAAEHTFQPERPEPTGAGEGIRSRC
jgi:acetoin utilization deacetylase AcuC-like enzyme